MHSMPLPCPKIRVGWTLDLFEKWVRKQDRKFVLEECKIALVIGNCTAHPNIENLKLIILYFLPPNTTSCLQPMDQGVIRSLNASTAVGIIRKIIRVIDNRKQIPSMSVLEAMKILALSWSGVSETIIINCFRKVGFTEGMRMMTHSLR